MWFLSVMLFATVLAASVWSIVETIRPRMGRILFLLQYGPVIGDALPQATRVTLRGRPVTMRMAVPARLRATA